MYTPNKKFQPSGYGFLAVMLAFIGFIAVHGGLQPETMTSAAVTSEETETANAESEAEEATETASFVAPRQLPIKAPSEIESESLWLARSIYSETKRPREQELVAWVVRNRVETGYRDNRSYRSAVLDPYQFSAFNPGSHKRAYYTSLDRSDSPAGWRRALSIASYVRNAPASLRPFPKSTRHFFSERSMVGGRHPNWARGKTHVEPERPYEIATKRFRFYKGIS